MFAEVFNLLVSICVPFSAVCCGLLALCLLYYYLHDVHCESFKVTLRILVILNSPEIYAVYETMCYKPIMTCSICVDMHNDILACVTRYELSFLSEPP